ncbi:cell division protein ZapE [Rhodopila sp.]|uniref:cell division protein ZapE n=1 Tax=Rhodopila sp. TaxID=2480087 RepID=UPI002B9FEBC6|nr:cell division protein ZapE [Rhodopila sp.]HVZ09079.1 cell division protein ZapE [Rhodopila sp.]
MDHLLPQSARPATGGHAGPLPAYRALVASGGLQADAAQERAAIKLQDLWERLRGYDPRPAQEPPASGFFGRLLKRRHTEEYMPLGLYLVGEVGRGKSMLMDLFFDVADVPRKQRIHFHKFMQTAHARIHAWKKANPGTADPIPPLADSIAAESALLCFDEFQVNDIADAMILGRLFQALFDRGVVVVATSNTEPDNLFKGQPGRDAFLPFIALLKQRLEVLVMDSARDYRRERMRGLRTWHVPADDFSRRALDKAFETLTGGAPIQPVTLTVMGRDLVVERAADGVARFDFDFLCNTALGAGDYLAIASAFHTVVLDGIPRLSPDNFDQARRFITLVDALYDQHIRLIASADATPDQLYQRGENARMFERTASRLDEMQSLDWLGIHQDDA